MLVHGGSAAAIMNVFPAPQHENMPRRTLGPSCQANMTDRHFSSSAMIKMMGSSLKELRERTDSEKAIEFIIIVIVVTKKIHPAAQGRQASHFGFYECKTAT